ncbi:hypothetical protein JB92DRAFT_2835815 [Gautieria morchelliformis]|nr:hypothetical protein JB92DRAFT_2835815 [Gautieria morchelliformis]
MSLNLPLKSTRVSLLALTTVSSIIAGAAAINAIRKSNSRKAALRQSVPTGVTVSIDTSDIEDTVIVLFVVTILLSMQIGNILLVLVKDWFRPYWPPRMTQPRNGVAVSTRTLSLQSWYLACNLGAILAVLIPATIFAARRMAVVKAFQGGIQLPDSVVLAAEAQLGIVGVYWNYFPVRFVIISNWINVLFTLPMTLASFVACSYRRNDAVSESGKFASDPTVAGEEGKVPG